METTSVPHMFHSSTHTHSELGLLYSQSVRLVSNRDVHAYMQTALFKCRHRNSKLCSIVQVNGTACC